MLPQTVILKHLLDDPQARKTARAILKAEHFISPVYRFLYGLLDNFNGSNGPISIDALAELALRKNLKKAAYEVLNRSYIELANIGTILESDFQYALKLLTIDARKEVFYNVINRLGNYLDQDRLDEAEQLLKELPDKSQALALELSGVSSLREMRQLRPDKKTERFETSFQVFDSITKGARAGELWFWVAATGEFKSTALMVIAHHNFIRGKKVFYISCEMDKVEVSRYLLLRHALHLKLRLSASELEFGEFKNTQIYKKVVVDFDDNKTYGILKIWKPSRLTTLLDLEREIYRLSLKEGCEVVCLDYLQKLKPLEKRQERRLEVTDLADHAKRFAMEANNGKGIVIFSGYQASRHGREMAEKNGYYDLSALSESAGAEQAANVICWSLQTNKMRKANEVKLGLAKARRASIKNSQHFIACDPEIGLFSANPIRQETMQDDDTLSEEEIQKLVPDND